MKITYSKGELDTDILKADGVIIGYMNRVNDETPARLQAQAEAVPLN